jgi:hypothetical protein
MLKFDRKRTIFFIATFIFVLEIASLSTFGFISNISVALTALSAVFFIGYSISYLLYSGNPKGYCCFEKYFPYLFCSILIIFIIDSAFLPLYLKAYPGIFGSELLNVLTTLPIFLPAILLIFFGMWLNRYKAPKKHEKRIKLISYILLAAGVAAFMAVFLSVAFSGYATWISDEEFLVINAVQVLLAGQNPYTASFTNALFNSRTNIVLPAWVTYTTKNTFEAGIDYPVLSLIASAPVVFISSLISPNAPYSSIDIYELTAFIAIMLLTIGLLLRTDQLKRPNIAVIAFLLLFATVFVSFINFLMLALLLVAYYKIDSKYLWILLGLAASLQEELWLVVVLFLVYSFRNYGFRKGVINLIGTIVIFLIINGYFIAASPHAYITQVLTPTSGYILPSPYAPFGYAILALYHVLLSSADVLFYASTISVIIAFAYLNEKRLMLLLPIIPLMFLFRSNAYYYVFFITAVAISFYIKDATAPVKTRVPKPRYRIAAIGSIIAISLIVVVLLIISHNQFNSIGISVSNQQIVIGEASNYSLYNAAIYNSNGGINQLSVIEYVTYYGDGSPSRYGITNGSIFASHTANTTNSSLGYIINPNRIYLNSSGGQQAISLLIPTNLDNSTLKVVAAECVLYNGAYYYTCPVARAT